MHLGDDQLSARSLAQSHGQHVRRRHAARRALAPPLVHAREEVDAAAAVALHETHAGIGEGWHEELDHLLREVGGQGPSHDRERGVVVAAGAVVARRARGSVARRAFGAPRRLQGVEGVADRVLHALQRLVVEAIPLRVRHARASVAGAQPAPQLLQLVHEVALVLGGRGADAPLAGVLLLLLGAAHEENGARGGDERCLRVCQRLALI